MPRGSWLLDLLSLLRVPFPQQEPQHPQEPQPANLHLQIIAPLDASQIFLDSASSIGFVQHLRNQHWSESRTYSDLCFPQEFAVDHTCFTKDITEEVKTNEGGNSAIGKCELYVYSTGVILMCCSYDLGVASAPDALETYKRLVHPKGEFTGTFDWVNPRYSDLAPNPQPHYKREVVLSGVYGSPGYHWTHGILSHVSNDDAGVLASITLKKFSHGESVEEHMTGSGLVRAQLGWEFTAVSTSVESEARLFCDLVRTMAYIWELHWIISKTAARQLLLVRETQEGSLESVRDFRRLAEILIASCDPTQLTMVERHFYVIKALRKEWHMSDLGHAVNESTELLDLIHTHAQQERSEKSALQLNMILAVITLLTLITVSKDAFEFFEAHHEHPIMTLFKLFTPIVVFGAGLLFLLWRSRRSRAD